MGTQKFYITSPIYYVNDRPHIGHAYTGLACDVLARFWRFAGREVHFLTGTDEHGQKVEKAATTRGLLPQEFTDELSQEFRKLAGAMNFSHDDFVRTTEPRHKQGAMALWDKLEQNGNIYLGEYQGWYAVRDEAFYADAELSKDSDGRMLAPSGAEVEWVSEPSYFFNLSQWQDKLLEFYASAPDFVAPRSRYNEVVSFVKSGLKDLSISRTTFTWGVPVPNAPHHIMYVWLDALANYITALGYPDDKQGLYKKFWPADLQIVGKDILRFHAVYWPAFLLAADLPPPKRIFAHGWWTNEGQKISKSLGNVIDPYALIDAYGIDQLRYFLLREIPFGNDGDFSHKAMVKRINADLANDLGNLCQRVLSFTYKHCDGKIPPYTLEKADNEIIIGYFGDVHIDMIGYMEKQDLAGALEYIWTRIAFANGYVNDMAPWSLRKTDEARMQTVLYVALAMICQIALALRAFMPSASTEILRQLGFDEGKFESAPVNNGDYTKGDFFYMDFFVDVLKRLTCGRAIPEPSAIFPRIVGEI